MANYNVVIGSKFKPYSYEEYVKPLIDQTEAHIALENQYADLATKAGVWEGILNTDLDKDTYAEYTKYSQDLEEQANNLATQGLSINSRQAIANMKKRYSNDIVPIEQSYNKRRELADEQRKLLAQDNTLMFDRLASTYSLKELMENPELSYQSYSGATLSKQVGTAAANLSKEMRENPRKWRSILGNQYFETIMQKGYRPEEIIQVMQNDPNASDILSSIVEDAVGSSNISSWGDTNTLNRAYEYARQGLWNAVGETQYQQVSNKAYDYAMQDELARKKTARTTAEANKNRLYYRAVPKTTVDTDKKTTQMNEDMAFLQEVMRNPSILNKKETKYTMGYPTMYGVTVGEGQKYEVSPNSDRLSEISKRYGFDIRMNETDGIWSSNLGELSEKLNADIKSSAVRSFSYKPNITQSDLITQVLKENTRSFYRRANETGIYELEDNQKGDAINIEDINSYFTSDSDIDFDPDLGFIINATDSDGKTRSAVLDTELLDDQNRTFSRAQQSIKSALDNGEDELATLLIEATMEAFYNRYNTLEKRQSNTFSKEE